MGNKKEELTTIEKAVLTYAFIEPSVDWQELFKLSHPESAGRKESTILVLTSRFKHSELSKAYLDRLRAIQTERDRRIYDERRKEEARKEGGEGRNLADPGREIDFTSREEFINYLNSAVNYIRDPKQKTDYLKMLADLLRFKESTPDGSTEIQQFYTPISCGSCPLMRAETEKSGSK